MLFSAFRLCSVLYIMCCIIWGHTAEGESLSRLGGGFLNWGKGYVSPVCDSAYILRIQWPSPIFSKGKHCSLQKYTLVSDSATKTLRDMRREGICCWRMLCHWRSPHRLTPFSTLPPLSSATYLPPALHQLLPMQQFYSGRLSNYWMGCVSSVCLHGFNTRVLCSA